MHLNFSNVLVFCVKKSCRPTCMTYSIPPQHQPMFFMLCDQFNHVQNSSMCLLLFIIKTNPHFFKNCTIYWVLSRSSNWCLIFRSFTWQYCNYLKNIYIFMDPLQGSIIPSWHAPWASCFKDLYSALQTHIKLLAGSEIYVLQTHLVYTYSVCILAGWWQAWQTSPLTHS